MSNFVQPELYLSAAQNRRGQDICGIQIPVHNLRFQPTKAISNTSLGITKSVPRWFAINYVFSSKYVLLKFQSQFYNRSKTKQ